MVNHKRTERLYREMGLSLRLRKRKKRVSHLRVVMRFKKQAAKAVETLQRDWERMVTFSEKKLSDMINLKWIFFLLLFLISLERFARKINGAY